MALSLYEGSVLSYLQTLGAVGGFLEKGLVHCRDRGLDPAAIVECRLFADMRPFRYQIQSVVHHSLGAIEGLRQGVFRPAAPYPDHDYPALQALIAHARDALQKVSPEEILGLEGADVAFEYGSGRLPFTAESFVLSFSLPDVHFHATTAYDILRHQGVPVGKADYMGTLRLKK